MNEPIEDYLDTLWSTLSGDPRESRRTLAEAESHLYEAAEAHRAAGLSGPDAERRAVDQFGPPAVVAPPLDPRDLLRPLTLFGAIGLLAVGASGAVAQAMDWLWGAAFVAGDPAGTSYPASRCAYFTEYYPSASCLHSAALHHADETVLYRIAAGVLGLLVLLAWRLLPRRRPLAPGYVPVAGLLVFGAAAAALLVQSVSTSSGGWHGAGQWLSAAIVSASVALGYAVRAYRPVANRAFVARTQP